MTSRENEHATQHDIWKNEHTKPFMFPFLDSTEPNPGVVRFWDWLVSRSGGYSLNGLDVCSGKGRNAIWLAGKGVKMSGFDFSEVAITEARCRQKRLLLPKNIDFIVHDAILPWPYDNHEFDFVLDCFGSSDIESQEGRQNVFDEAFRVLKPGRFYFLQIVSPEMGFFADRFTQASGMETNTLVFPNGKVESFLTEADISNWRHPLNLIEVRREIETTLEIYGQTAPYKYFWLVAQSPSK